MSIDPLQLIQREYETAGKDLDAFNAFRDAKKKRRWRTSKDEGRNALFAGQKRTDVPSRRLGMRPDFAILYRLMAEMDRTFANYGTQKAPGFGHLSDNSWKPVLANFRVAEQTIQNRRSGLTPSLGPFIWHASTPLTSGVKLGDGESWASSPIRAL